MTKPWGLVSWSNPGSRTARADPERYVARFGLQAYEMMLADCHWAVYGMLGKLSRHVWLLSPA